MEEKEKELMDYLNIIWKYKWLIIIGTVSCIVVAVIVSFIMKPVFEIDAIIQPGKFFVRNENGNFESCFLSLRAVWNWNVFHIWAQ